MPYFFVMDIMCRPPFKWFWSLLFLTFFLSPFQGWAKPLTTPEIVSVTISSNGIYKKGQFIDITLQTSEAVTVTVGSEAPYIPITLDTGSNAKAIYYSGSGSNSLVFRYTVDSTHSDHSGIVLETSVVSSNSTITNVTSEVLLPALRNFPITTGIVVSGIVPKVISNIPIGVFPTTRREIPFTIKFNKPITGLSKSSFDVVASGTMTATVTGLKKMNDTTYKVWVTDQTVAYNYTGTIKLNIKSASATTILDFDNQTLDTNSIKIGTAAKINDSLPILIYAYQPTPTIGAGQLLDIYGANLARIDKVLMGDVPGKIILNTDTTLQVLTMPGADTINATLKIIRGGDTVFPVFNKGIYKVIPSQFPYFAANKLQPIFSNGRKDFTNFALEKNGQFAIICNDADNTNAGGCAYYFYDNTENYGIKLGWRQIGQNFTHPRGSLPGTYFGTAVSISANQNNIAIASNSGPGNRGDVTIYNNSQNYYFNNNARVDSILTVDTVLSAVSVGSDFGRVIELSADGNTLFVGAPGYNGNEGAVHIYNKTSEGWSLMQTLQKPNDADANAMFGSSLTLSADGLTALIASTTDQSKGAVWVYKLINQVWYPSGLKIQPNGLSTSAKFGTSMTMSANAGKIIIAADGQNNNKGAVYYYKLLNNIYTQVGNALTDTTSDLTSKFGACVTMSSNGDLFVVSAPLNNIGGAHFYYGLKKDSIELLSSVINKSADSVFGTKMVMDYQGTRLLKTVSYANLDKVIASSISLPTPQFLSLNKSYFKIANSDTAIAKVLNARSVNKVFFADTLSLNFSILTDTTLQFVMDSSIKQAKNRINFRSGILDAYSDSVIVDKIQPTVKVIINKTGAFNDTVFNVKLRFNKKIATDIVAHFPVLPNAISGVPSARLDSVKVDTLGFVYTGYFKAMKEGPIFFNNSNLAAFTDTVGNNSLAIPNSDTIIFDKTTIKPLLYVNNDSRNIYRIDINIPEKRAFNSLKLTFFDYYNDTAIYTWVLSNSITNTASILVNVLDNPTSNPDINFTLPVGASLKSGRYNVRLLYRDSLLNPPDTSTAYWPIFVRDSFPDIYTYTPTLNNGHNLLSLKGINFSNVDSVKIGTKRLAFSSPDDNTLNIENKVGAGSGYINLYFDGDSTVLDQNEIKGGNYASTELVIKKTWQKFTNLRKGKLGQIKLSLANASSSTDNNLVLQLYKDTVVTNSLDPSVKFTSVPLAVSDTFKLLRNATISTQSFTFSNTTVFLEDSTNYFFVLKQLDNAENVSFTILADQNNSKSGAVNGSNVELDFQVATKAYVLIDTIPPQVKISFNKTGVFTDSVFQVKLRFTEKVTTDIVNHFPVMPNVFNGLPTAQKDSVKLDTAGLVYTGYFKALLNAPIYFQNPNFNAFEDSAGNISLPILGSDTIYFDNKTIKPFLYTNPLVRDTLLLDIIIPEIPAPNTAKLTFTNIETLTTITWILSNTISPSNSFKVNPLNNPTTFSFVSTVLPTGATLNYGRYRIKLSYQDTLLHAADTSDTWDINIISNKPIVKSYTPIVNSNFNLLTLKGINFLNIDSTKIGNKLVQDSVLNDSTMLIIDKRGAVDGFINFYQNGDSTHNEYNLTNGAIITNAQVPIKKTWQKFKNINKGKLKDIKLKLSNTSTTIDHILKLDLYKDTLLTNSLDPALKFGNTPIISSDTIKLLRNSALTTKVFTFSSLNIFLEDTTDYFFVIKQQDNAENTNFKILVDTSFDKTGAINEKRVGIDFELSSKAFVIMDTIPPTAFFFNPNVNKAVKGPSYLDVIFSEPVVDFSTQHPPLIPSQINGQPAATIDSVVVVIPNMRYRTYFTPTQIGKIYFFNFYYDNTRDLAGNPALPIGQDSVIYIGDKFTLSDYDYPYTWPARPLSLFGKGFNYVTNIKLNNQVLVDSLVNDSLIIVTLPNNARSGRLIAYNLIGDSTSGFIDTVNPSAAAAVFADTSFVKFIPKTTGVIDSIQFYFINSNSTNVNYYLKVFDHNFDRVYRRFIAGSDTAQILSQSVQAKTNFKFNNQQFVVFKDSTYYIKLVQIGNSLNEPYIVADGNNKPKYNYALTPHLFVDTLPMTVNVSNNAVNRIVEGQYYVDIRFNRPMREVTFPLMIPGVDTGNNIVARIDSTVISDDGLTYREYVSPLKKGTVFVYNFYAGVARDYFGFITPPLMFDTVFYINTKKPLINVYNTAIVTSGRIIEVIGKNLTNTSTVKVGGVNASFYVKNDDTLSFISPLNASSGKIELFNQQNQTASNIIDTFYTIAGLTNTANYAWQKLTILRPGAFSKIGVKLNNTSNSTIRFKMRLFNKNKNLSSLNQNLKFDTAIVNSDTISVNTGTNQFVYFTFDKEKYVASKDSTYYFVLYQLDSSGSVNITYDPSVVLNGGVNYSPANIKHTLELEPYLLMDTTKPLPTLQSNKNKVVGSFYVDLKFSEPIQNLSPNPIIVSPGQNNLPKAILNSTQIITPGLLYRYFYTPSSPGKIEFSIPFYGIANDIAGNVSEAASTIFVDYIDTTINNFVSALGPTNICIGDSVKLIVSVDSTLDFKWNTTAANNARSITVKKSGIYYIKMQIDSNTFFTSNSVTVLINEYPVKPIIARVGDSIQSSAPYGNIWYKNATRLTDTTRKIKPNLADYYSVASNENGCMSSLSAPYFYVITDINEDKEVNFKISPNPFQDQVIVQYNNKVTPNLSLEIINVSTGALVNKFSLPSNINKLNLPQLSSGIYLFKLIDVNGKLYRQYKMVKL